MDNKAAFASACKWYDARKYLPGDDGTYILMLYDKDMNFIFLFECSYMVDGTVDDESEVFIRVPEEDDKKIHVEDRAGKPTFYTDSFLSNYDDEDLDSSCDKYKEQDCMYEICSLKGLMFWTPQPRFEIRDGKLMNVTSESFDEDNIIELTKNI